MPAAHSNDMLLRTRVLLRGTLLAAAAHSALAQTCASYCHWDIKNCLVSEQHCRGCDACVAAAAKSGPTDGCYSWCSAAQDHCAKEKAKCGGCDFCGGQSAPCSPKVGGDREYLSCEGWCSEVRPPRTHTPPRAHARARHLTHLPPRRAVGQGGPLQAVRLQGLRLLRRQHRAAGRKARGGSVAAAAAVAVAAAGPRRRQVVLLRAPVPRPAPGLLQWRRR